MLETQVTIREPDAIYKNNELLVGLPTTAERLLRKHIPDFKPLRLAKAPMYPFASYDSETGVTRYTALIDYPLCGSHLEALLQSVSPYKQSSIGQIVADWGRLAVNGMIFPQYEHEVELDPKKKDMLRKIHNHYLPDVWKFFMNNHVNTLLNAIQAGSTDLEMALDYFIAVWADNNAYWFARSEGSREISLQDMHNYGINEAYRVESWLGSYIDLNYHNRLKARISSNYASGGDEYFLKRKRVQKFESTLSILPVLQWEKDQSTRRTINTGDAFDDQIVAQGLALLDRKRSNFSAELENPTSRLSTMAGDFFLGYLSQDVRNKTRWPKTAVFYDPRKLMTIGQAQVPIRFLEDSEYFAGHQLLPACEQHVETTTSRSARVGGKS